MKLANRYVPHPLFRRWLLFSGMALALMFVMIVFSGKALAHGYIDSPSSRADLCAKGVNKNAGSSSTNRKA